jgi:hypothetical protein
MLVSTRMITGFNTDVKFEDNVYHVQTEDRGLDNPMFESLIYIGGSIVAKKLTPYSDKLSEGATEETLASLLKRQHQVVIAAIRAGRIEDLIRHTREQDNKQSDKRRASGRLARPEVDRPPDFSNQDPLIAPAVPASPARVFQSKPERASSLSSGKLKLPVPKSSARGDSGVLDLDQVISDYLNREQTNLDVEVLTPEAFTAGENIILRVRVSHNSKPEFDAIVTVKIIGTAFKPQVFIGRIGRDGAASFRLTLPSFTAGTAAIVIEARSESGTGELKNLIRRS